MHGILGRFVVPNLANASSSAHFLFMEAGLGWLIFELRKHGAQP